MPQPADVETIANQLARLFAAAQQEIEQQLTGITEGRRAARLRELQRTINALLNSLDSETRVWVQSQLPVIYQLGGVDAAALIGDTFLWSQPHIAALQGLASRSFDDLLKSTRFVRRDVKDWIRNETRQQTTFSLLEGRTARQAGRALADAAGGDLGLFTVVYKDGSRHRLADYADSTLRAVSAETYNTGTITMSREAGVQFAEVADGAECGLSSHDDGEKPNGKIYPLDFIAQFPISHPRCRRSILPRIDAKSTDVASLRTDAQIADQTRSELATSGRSPRTARTPRQPRRVA